MSQIYARGVKQKNTLIACFFVRSVDYGYLWGATRMEGLVASVDFLLLLFS